ncbi:unnamed protein product, partial [Meganyctiphanes norvegica]
VTAYTTFKCYVCQGYDDNFTQNNINNKYCSNKHWDGSKVSNVSNGDASAQFIDSFCSMRTIPSPTSGRTLQQRDIMGYRNFNGVKTLMRFNGTSAEPTKLDRDSVDMDGYFCQKDFCNSALGSLGGCSLLTALCPTLLIKLF